MWHVTRDEFRVEVMKQSHFELDTAKARIQNFFDEAAARTGGAGSGDDSMDDGDDSAEFGCVREGKLPPSAASLWAVLLSAILLALYQK